MRIVHFVHGRCNPDSANGIDKTVYYLSRAQAELGHDVAVLSLTEKPAIPIPGVHVVTAPFRLPPPLPSTRSRAGDVLGRASFHVPNAIVVEFRSWRPEVLHLHSVHSSQNIVLARHARSAGIPYCVSIHGGLAPSARRRDRWPKRAFQAVFERPYLERAAFVHATSDQDAQGLVTFGVENEVVLAPNGIDPESMPAHPDPGALIREYPVLDGRRVFLFMGRLDPDQKGLDLLIEAFARAGRTEAALVLVGPDWLGRQADLRDQAQRLGLADRIVFSGPAFGARKFDYLAAADVFVHTSRWEGAPFSVLEAATAGRALLLSEAADPYGLVERHGAGVRVELTITDIADTIGRLASADASELARMGANARAAALAEFGWRPIARKLVDAYATARV